MAHSVWLMVVGWALAQAALNAMLAAITAAATGSIAVGYLTVAAVLVATTVPYALRSRDIALPAELRPPFDWGEFWRGFWVSPRRYPDFGWAWFTRFLMNLGNAFLILYLLYYLTDAVGLSDDEAATGVFRLTACTGRSRSSPRSSAAGGPTGWDGARCSSSGPA